MSLTGAIKNTISISLFNRGQAGRVFDDLKTTGPKVVIRNNEPACVVMSPDDYLQLIDKLEEMKMMNIAQERLMNFDSASLVSQDELDKDFGWTKEDIEKWDDVEIEGMEDIVGK